MPTEIIGKLGSLYLEPHSARGTLIIESSIPIKYGEKIDLKNHNISVPFITDNSDSINVIRKADGQLKLTGRFDNNLSNNLVFYAKTAEEI